MIEFSDLWGTGVLALVVLSCLLFYFPMCFGRCFKRINGWCYGVWLIFLLICRAHLFLRGVLQKVEVGSSYLSSVFIQEVERGGAHLYLGGGVSLIGSSFGWLSIGRRFAIVFAKISFQSIFYQRHDFTLLLFAFAVCRRILHEWVNGLWSLWIC